MGIETPYRTVRTAVGRKRWRHKGHLLRAAMPALAQIIVLTALLLQRQWLFALMVSSGIFGMLASFTLTYTPDSPHHSPPIGSYESDGACEPHHHNMNRIARMPTPRDRDFMTIFGFGDDEAPMRTICHRWCVASHTSGLRATLGVDASGRPLSVDIDSEGPHAIVAGTTGSGKSVLLQCWCLALAVTYPPDRLGFVFLDFKGGSALDRLAALPHVRGCVNDLDLSYASRALRALEDELSCREHLAARHHVSDIRQLPDAPARLMIVVDEFHMLNEQLPGYMDRLLRVASLGRSLGMHLVVCTQNPMVEINASMKANMSLRICLRVQDAMQSQEMIGSALASTIPVDCPGTAVLNHEGECVILQCLQPSNIGALTVQIHQSARFFGQTNRAMLFTPPLPSDIDEDELSCMHIDACSDASRILIGVADTGVSFEPAFIDLCAGSVAIIAPPHRGAHTLLERIRREAMRHGTPVDCFPDADEALEPMKYMSGDNALRLSIADTSTLTVFSLRTSRPLRIPDHASVRIVFACGDRNADLADGIPADMLADHAPSEFMRPGRAVLLEQGCARLIQCIRDRSGT